MNSQKIRSFLHLGIIILSVVIGTLIIAPILKIDIRFGLFIGGILGIILNGIIFPKEKQELSEKNNGKHIESMSTRPEDSLYNYFVHSTNIPINISIIIFFLTIILVVLFDKFNKQVSQAILYTGLLGAAFLWGLSGFKIVTQNEYVDMHGNKYKGLWAILNGLLFIIMGWGAIIGVVLGTIFKW